MGRRRVEKKHKAKPAWTTRLEELRKHVKLDQVQFAKTLGLASQQAYNRFAMGKSELKAELCLKIRKEYGVSLDWLIAGNEPVTSTRQVPVEWKPGIPLAVHALSLSEMIAALAKDPALLQSDRPPGERPQPKSQDRSAGESKPGKPSPRKT